MFTHTHLMVSYHKPELLRLYEGVVELVGRWAGNRWVPGSIPAGTVFFF